MVCINGDNPMTKQEHAKYLSWKTNDLLNRQQNGESIDNIQDALLVLISDVVSHLNNEHNGEQLVSQPS